jgi:3'-phosphoadenosine 5'-phosphosulfate sulfotransferase (PAPS reductase)/FAD synthetase
MTDAVQQTTDLEPAPISDPFYITGPAVISFSGGRTSGLMLRRVLDAHGGTLPDDVVVAFANTGREMPATLDFVQECGDRWGVPIAWIEYRWAPGGPSYERVNHNTASRAGEPLEALFRSKSMLPNPVSRFCTIETKIRTMKRFIRAEYGWDRWKNVVGLRADEMGRVGKATDPERNKKDRWDVVCPLAEAGINEGYVLEFWAAQDFDLRLNGKWEGNCDGCFLKSRGALSRMMLDHPERMQWWAAQEAVPRGAGAGATFRADREPYAKLAEIVRNQGRLPFNIFDDGTACEWSCTD